MNRRFFISALLIVFAAGAVGCEAVESLAALGDLSLLGSCVLPDGYPAVGLTELQAADDAAACTYSGQTVMVRGPVVMARNGCTAMACAENNPCCNCCTADFGFGTQYQDSFISIKNDTGSELRCEGDDCDMYCYGIEPDVDYVVWGTFECTEASGGSGTVVINRSLTIQGFCKLSTEATPTDRFPRAGYCNSFM